MKTKRVYALIFASVYPHYVRKAETKGRTREELDACLRWLTGYSQKGLEKVIETKVDLRTFFEEAPKLNPNVSLIKGTVCGIRVEDIEAPPNAKDPLHGQTHRRTRQRQKDGKDPADGGGVSIYDYTFGLRYRCWSGRYNGRTDEYGSLDIRSRVICTSDSRGLVHLSTPEREAKKPSDFCNRSDSFVICHSHRASLGGPIGKRLWFWG